MKKTSFSLALLGVLAGGAQAQSNVTVYGRIDTGLTYNDTVASSPAGSTNAAGTSGKRVGMDTSILAGSRFGFRGVEDLGGGLATVFNLEAGISPDTGASAQGGVLFGRRASVGISGALGTINVGRFWERGGEGFLLYNAILDFGALAFNIHDNCQDTSAGCYRMINAIRYDTPNVAGFTGSATLGLGEQAGSSSAGRSGSLTGEYSNGPFGAGITYFEGRLGSTPSASGQAAQGALAGAPGDIALKSWTLGARYVAGPARFYGSFSRTKQPLAIASAINSFSASPTFLPTASAFASAGSNNDKTDVLDIGMSYRLNGFVTLITAVEDERVHFVGASGGKARQYNIGAQYTLSKRSVLYAMLSSQRASGMYLPGIIGGAPGRNKTQNVFALGIDHTF
jgi:predicted porin